MRHWTPQQKSRLERSEKGKKLLEAENKQQDEWRQKHNSLGTLRDKISYENFQWAMEAVHSRAFRGDFGGEILCATTFPCFVSGGTNVDVLHCHPTIQHLMVGKGGHFARSPHFYFR